MMRVIQGDDELPHDLNTRLEEPLGGDWCVAQKSIIEQHALGDELQKGRDIGEKMCRSSVQFVRLVADSASKVGNFLRLHTIVAYRSQC